MVKINLDENKNDNPVAAKSILFGLSFLCFFFIMYCTPFSSDDFEFFWRNLSEVKANFLFSLYYGNGRLLGNMGAAFLVLHPVLCAGVKAFVITAIIFLLPAVLELKGLGWYILSFLMLVLIDPSLFGQVYTWTCGFQNYIPPILLNLFIIRCIQHYPSVASKGIRAFICTVIFLCGIASQLYVEHVSVIAVLLAAAFIWEGRKAKYTQGAAPRWIWLVAAVIGLVMMFLIPVLFFEEGNRSEGYRSFNTDSIASLIRSAVATALLFGSYYSSFAIVVVTVASACVLYCYGASRSEMQNRCLTILHMVSAIYLLINDIFCDNEWYGAFSTPRKMITLLFIVVQFGVWVYACFAMDEHCIRNRILALLGYAGMSLAPLLFVSPTPLRVVYLTYFLIVAAALLSVTPLAQRLNQMQKARLSFAGKTAVFTVMLLLCMLFLNVRWLAKTRETYIADKMNQGVMEIEVFAIPYEYVYWDGIWCFKKEYYYEKQGDIVFTEAEFGVWMDEHYTELQ